MNYTLAEKMFEGVFSALPDVDINRMHAEIQDMKRNHSLMFRSLIKTPYVKHQFEMIEDEWEYRNQMIE